MYVHHWVCNMFADDCQWSNVHILARRSDYSHPTLQAERPYTGRRRGQQSPRSLLFWPGKIPGLRNDSLSPCYLIRIWYVILFWALIETQQWRLSRWGDKLTYCDCTWCVSGSLVCWEGRVDRSSEDEVHREWSKPQPPRGQAEGSNCSGPRERIVAIFRK